MKKKIKLEIPKRVTSDNLKSVFICAICFASQPAGFFAYFYCKKF